MTSFLCIIENHKLNRPYTYLSCQSLQVNTTLPIMLYIRLSIALAVSVVAHVFIG